jgi:hypothetical protein
MGPPAPATWDPGQFLYVDVDELTRPGHLEAPDGGAGQAVEMVEPVEPVAHKNPVHRRGRHVDNPGDPSRPEAPLGAQCSDPALSRSLGLGRATTRPRRAILEASDPFHLVAAPPDIGPIPRDPHRGGCMGDRPAAFDTPTGHESTGRGELSVTVH